MPSLHRESILRCVYNSMCDLIFLTVRASQQVHNNERGLTAEDDRKRAFLAGTSRSINRRVLVLIFMARAFGQYRCSACLLREFAPLDEPCMQEGNRPIFLLPLSAEVRVAAGVSANSCPSSPRSHKVRSQIERKVVYHPQSRVFKSE